MSTWVVRQSSVANEEVALLCNSVLGDVVDGRIFYSTCLPFPWSAVECPDGWETPRDPDLIEIHGKEFQSVGRNRTEAIFDLDKKTDRIKRYYFV